MQVEALREALLASRRWLLAALPVLFVFPRYRRHGGLLLLLLWLLVLATRVGAAATCPATPCGCFACIWRRDDELGVRRGAHERELGGIR